MTALLPDRISLTAKPKYAPPTPTGQVVLRYLAAVVIPVALAFNRPLGHEVTSGMIASFLFAPLWLKSFVRIPAGAVFLLAGTAFLFSGFLLSWVSLADHEVEKKLALVTALTYAVAIGAVGALYWACQVLGVHRVLAIYGFAWLVDALISPQTWGDNLWKHAFALPITLLVLFVVDEQPSLTIKVTAVLALGFLSAANDVRSMAGAFLLTAFALGWQRIRSKDVGEPSIARFLAVAVVIAGAAYYFLTRLLISGALGTELQARSDAQVEASGSLLIGGRPEWTVTIRLFGERPWGFGFGTIASPSDYELGRQGFASIHLSSQEGYLKHYVFNGSFSLHSVAADMWSVAGPAALPLLLIMLWMMLTAFAHGLAYRTASAAQIFLAITALWNIGFSPYWTSLQQVMLAVAISFAVGLEKSRPPGRVAVPAPVA